jgi:hypothetical protein
MMNDEYFKYSSFFKVKSLTVNVQTVSNCELSDRFDKYYFYK